MLDCLSDIKAWIALNFLNFSDSKTEVIILRPSGACGSPELDLGSLGLFVKPVVTNLGVNIDCDFKLDKQINSVVKSIFFPN